MNSRSNGWWLFMAEHGVNNIYIARRWRIKRTKHSEINPRPLEKINKKHSASLGDDER